MPNIERILVASDLSSGAARALARAALLAAQNGARLAVLHVLDPAPPPGARPDAEAVARAVETELRQEVDRLLAQQRGERPVETTVRVVAGRDFEEIIAQAAAERADLVVLGAHGAHTVRELFIGTTADRVVRMGDRPVLIVKRRPRGPYRRLLVPLDYSGASKLALELAVRLAGGATTHVLHVCDVGFEPMLRRAGATEAELEQYRLERVGAATDALERFLQDSGYAVGAAPGRAPAVEPIVEAGRPADVIPRVARLRRADLVVMGTRGQTASPRLLLGSVAQHVVRDAPCDVLVVRPGASGSGTG